jgi:outer membrane protein TolC
VRCIALVAQAAISAGVASAAQPNSPLTRDVEAVTHEYVGLALDSNLALQNQQLEVQRAAAALRAARARFLPEVALQALHPCRRRPQL